MSWIRPRRSSLKTRLASGTSLCRSFGSNKKSAWFALTSIVLISPQQHFSCRLHPTVLQLPRLRADDLEYVSHRQPPSFCWDHVTKAMRGILSPSYSYSISLERIPMIQSVAGARIQGSGQRQRSGIGCSEAAPVGTPPGAFILVELAGWLARCLIVLFVV